VKFFVVEVRAHEVHRGFGDVGLNLVSLNFSVPYSSLDLPLGPPLILP
jgi:hypothetical protein